MKELAGGLYLTEDTNELQQVLRRYGQEQATLQQILSPAEYKKVEMTAIGIGQDANLFGGH